MRIVSTLASGTEVVHALGLDDALVGISHECDYPSSLLDRPRVSRPRFDPAGLDSLGVDQAVRAAMAEHGSVYSVDADLLKSLDPDLILAQAVCEVCAVPTLGVRRMVEEHGLRADVLSLDAHRIEDVFELILAVGSAAHAAKQAHALVDSLRARVERVRQAVADAPTQRVLAIEWLAPPFAPGHWVPEMIQIAGGTSLTGSAGNPSYEQDWSDLNGLDPDVLILMPCGYDLAASLDDAEAHAKQLRRVAPRAIGEGRAFAVDGSAYFNRSGPRVVDGIEILAALLHPERLGTPSADQAQRWPH